MDEKIVDQVKSNIRRLETAELLLSEINEGRKENKVFTQKVHDDLLNQRRDMQELRRQFSDQTAMVRKIYQVIYENGMKAKVDEVHAWKQAAERDARKVVIAIISGMVLLVAQLVTQVVFFLSK